MIARHEAPQDKTDLWGALAAPLAQSGIAWRQDGRSVQRDGRWYARFVAYVEANTVRERLDAVVPGEWDLTLDLLPALPGQDDEGQTCAFKARLQILGVIREDVGTGRDYKAAATDAFKRAAVRFGIAHELYQLDANWVQVDGEGRHAKPLEDPQAAYDRRASRTDVGQGLDRAIALPGVVNLGSAAVAVAPDAARSADRSTSTTRATANGAGTGMDTNTQECPQCGGRMWDNRLTKRNPKAPDFKCRDRSCDGVIWPPRDGVAKPVPVEPDEPMEIAFDSSPLGASIEDEIPF